MSEATASETTEDTLFYLWHLELLGVLSRTDTGFESPLWEKAQQSKEPVTVAIIDNGVDPGHPNLTGNLHEQVDFGSHLFGTTYHPPFETLRKLRFALEFEDDLPESLGELVSETQKEIELWSTKLGLNAAFIKDQLDKLAGADAKDTALAQATKLLKILDDTSSDPGDTEDMVSHAGPRFEEPFLSPEQMEMVGKFIQSNFGLPRSTMLDFDNLERKHFDREGDHFRLHEGNADDAVVALWAKIKEKDRWKQKLPLRDPSEFFGAHGTACAGLVSGRPPVDPDAEDPGEPSVIPYYGMNPFGRVLSLSTPYSHEFLPVIHALLMAFASDAKVILMPRGITDIGKRAKTLENSERTTRIDAYSDDITDPADQANLRRLAVHQAILEALLKAMSKEKWIVLAAGNSGTSKLGYPANIQDPENDKLVIVGARNRRSYFAKDWKKYVSTYSSGRDYPILHVLSDDAPVFDKSRIAFDEQTERVYEENFLMSPEQKATNTFSPWRILSLDLRGNYGYSAEGSDDAAEYDPGLDRASIYTLFGGTSAASSIAAGLISLHLQAGTDGFPDSPSEIYENVNDYLHRVFTGENLEKKQA